MANKEELIAAGESLAEQRPAIAESMYRAYGVFVGNKNHLGNEMPAFADLPRKIQLAWEAAAGQGVILFLGYLAGNGPISAFVGDEAVWKDARNEGGEA